MEEEQKNSAQNNQPQIIRSKRLEDLLYVEPYLQKYYDKIYAQQQQWSKSTLKEYVSTTKKGPPRYSQSYNWYERKSKIDDYIENLPKQKEELVKELDEILQDLKNIKEDYQSHKDQSEMAQHLTNFISFGKKGYQDKEDILEFLNDRWEIFADYYNELNPPLDSDPEEDQQQEKNEKPNENLEQHDQLQQQQQQNKIQEEKQ